MDRTPRLQQPVPKRPYRPVIALFMLAHAIDLVGSRTAAWRWLADRIVSAW
jgi:hypothetical protein